jgi:hypothetical protein
LEQLTTPELRENDAVFPGENWFFYWKTSPSLWEVKLREYQGPNPIFVPIYWALHSEYNDHFDFGQHKPETDLGRLENCAKAQGKELIFLVPLSPSPFLSNGGIPSYLARSLSMNKEGLAIAALDNAQNINRIYSFYDPKTFQAFRKFVWNLGQYFSQSGSTSSVYGLDNMRIEDGHIVSYFKDHSQVFDNGFNRFIKQLQDSEPEKVQRLIDEPQYENNLKLEYSTLIQSLYKDAAEEFLAGSWGGIVKSCLLGGAAIDIFRRGSDLWESEQNYFAPLMKCVVNEVYPTTVLLGNSLRRGPLGKAFKDIIDTNLIRTQLDDDYYSDESSLSFQPLVFFELNDGGEGHFSFEKAMNESGLKYYFEKEFAWSYKIKHEFSSNVEDLDERSVYFYFGHRLDQANFNKVLKIFMNGYKVFLDIANLDPALMQKLELFFTENELKTESINYISPVVKASLGEGLIITYDSRKLKETSLIKRAGFWDTMVKFLDVKHLKVEADEGVHFFWRTRSSNTYELNYEEIRRVSFYNPTSYKKKAHIVSSKNFSFIKTIDQVKVEVKSTPIGIDLLMLPGSHVTLDFGYFE